MNNAVNTAVVIYCILSFLQGKEMEIARHVLDTYFQDITNPLVRHHLDSYADMVNSMIPNFIKGTNPLRIILEDDRSINVFIGGRGGDEIFYSPPVDDVGNAILPHTCRLNNETYALDVRANIEIDYTIGSDIETRKFEKVMIGKLPLMLKSSLCYLSTMTSDELYDAGECKFELGGYFIISGAEKALLTQERLGDNMFYASKRVQQPSSEEKRTLSEKELVMKLDEATKDGKFEFIAGVKSVSEDGTKGPYSHFLVIPPKNRKSDDPKVVASTPDFATFSTKRLALITLPGFTQPVPLMSIFYALGLTNDQDIYDTFLAGIPQEERTQYDETFAELILSHERFVAQEMAKETDQDQDPNMLLLRKQTRTRSTGGIYVNLYDQMFPHCEKLEEESAAAFYRRKAYLLGELLHLAMDVAIGIKPKTDRDHFRFKRLIASGNLCFNEFRRIYKEVSKRMLTELDTRLHFEQNAYVGKKIAELVQDENIEYYWRSFNFLNDISKSFKGKWGGKDGVSQELSRLAYLGTVAQLRRVNLDMDKGTKVIEPRRIHSSSWGFMCPTDNPDGGNIGMIKSMTLFCSISTASDSRIIGKLIRGFSSFLQISDIHPSTWNPSWTKVFVNSDLVGVLTARAEEFHKLLLSKRRNQEIDKFVSLCWTRIDNTYIISTDAGRVCRPIYQEGTTGQEIMKTTKWDQISKKHMDYIDSQETESLRISMIPFSPTIPSEIHGSMIFSASASVIPNSDFNQAPRNMFSCQQTKQACSWYNTAFNKRFDTIATWLNYAQRPLSQTWTVGNILGKSGCLPYGENAIVALAIYSGYNQDDSIIVNDSSLRRGLFNTTYYHSYEKEEEMLDVATQKHTEFANIAVDPKYRETVARKEGYNYDMLDSDGIIKQGSEINDETILVGIVTPVTNAGGQIIGYRDASYTPKRGQTGVIDGIYRYPTRDGLHAVKIRIAERRVPVLGDKYSARHGQKGTVGMRIPEEDMPYTASGLRPDMIVNPHAFPSRMTIGQFIETMSTKVGTHLGTLVDSTPFSTQGRVEEMKDLLLKTGYHPYGHEVIYNGQTGEMMETEIFMGPTYYLRLKHMVEDKINYRATGPKKLLTHQPVEGRSNEGGLRIGEMERDGLISHGLSKFLNESLMERSDKAELLFQPESGLLDSNSELETSRVVMPYALGLIIHELESMHISVKLAS